MTLILCIKKGRSRENFMRDARRSGVNIEPVRGLPRHFIVEGHTADTFPLANHTALISIEDGDQKVEITATRPLVIQADLTGANWALARHVRRDPPWNVDRIAHPINTYTRSVRDGSGVDIYLIDARPLASHSEFGSRLTEIGTTDSGGDNHGTATCSIAAGSTVGMAPAALLWNYSYGAKFAINFTLGMGEVLEHYNGRASTNRPAVCSFSFAIPDSTTWSEAVADLIDAGIVVCASAGNNAEDLATNPQTPAVLTDVICCGALLMNDTPAFFGGGTPATNYGARVDVSAGGEYVLAADNTGANDYFRFRGTSASTPLVAGVVACMLQGKSRLTTRTQVQAVRAKVIANATTGRLRDQPQFGIPAGGLPDRILYLDPDISSEEIAGVT